GRNEPAELNHQHGKYQEGAEPEHHQELAERLALRFVLPADFIRIADRQRKFLKSGPNIADRAAKIAAFEAPRDARHAAQVFAKELRLSVRPCRMRDKRD